MLPAAVRALSVVPRSFDELVNGADAAFKGTVTAVNPQWTGVGAERHTVTYVIFRVEDTHKGDVVPSRTLRFFGGTVGGTTMEIPGLPHFDVGQIAVLFVTGNGQQFCPLAGVHQGRFHVTRDAGGIERITTDDGSPVVKTNEIGQLAADGTPVLRRYALTPDDRHDPRRLSDREPRQGALIDGSATWNQVAVSAMQDWNQYFGGGVHLSWNETALTPQQGDGVNTVAFGPTIYGESFGHNTLAVTLLLKDQPTTHEADVLVNSAQNFSFVPRRSTYQ